jgi:hypothetical protein
MIEAAVAEVLAARDRVDRFNPFLVSHHSDTATSPSGTLGSSPRSVRKEERVRFKREVATYYGLATGDPNTLVDMFGVVCRFDEVTLAHVWPNALVDAAPSLEDKLALALPHDFYRSPRNYLLLGKDVHDAFDAGLIAFIPSRGAINVRAFKPVPAAVSAQVAGLMERQLVLPRAAEGHVPFRRLLAWFAWLAKGLAVLPVPVVAEFDEPSLTASANAEAAKPLMALLDDAVRVRRVSRAVQALVDP